MSAAAAERDWTTAYQQPVEELLAVLGTDGRRGLGGAEARARLEKGCVAGITSEQLSYSSSSIIPFRNHHLETR
jgi:hypothetical protein